ncbi:lipoate--protein ligase [Oceanobacillus polygoni]|uniref:lipoate--protein ligase n=1 Tax=Oceanobacillus polygoni TaxID=1235259 RepID=A0A9X1CK15_9BACI|nr:lipoate--protein ligase [Oceanobacillus polygoni]MBP2079152.1 lipoate-protein ligase A [Oceanobacillus polygoni]
MYLIESKRNGEWIYDPGMAMALQEYVKDHIFLDDDVLFPYMMQPAVQIGKFQNAYEEVNQPYMDAHDIKIIRRETGGGAIYLDDRNMSFCFLFDGSTDIHGNYARLYEPVVKALENLGVDQLEQKGRNDLVLDGKKVSGAAMTLQNGRIYAGYSLLLDPNYEAMVSVLNPNQKKIKSHGIQSVRSRVGSIRPHLAPEYREMTVWEFTDYIICQLLEINDVSEAKRYELTPEDWAGVDKIAADKYNNWDWNYGRFQQFEYRLTERFPIGTISVGLTIEHAKITAIQISGDFFGTKNIKDVEEVLVGVRLRKEDLLNALDSLELANYFGNLTKEEFVSFILSEKA